MFYTIRMHVKAIDSFDNYIFHQSTRTQQAASIYPRVVSTFCRNPFRFAVMKGAFLLTVKTYCFFSSVSAYRRRVEKFHVINSYLLTVYQAALLTIVLS